MSTVTEDTTAPQDAAMPAKKRSSNTFDGTLIRVTGNTLVMTSKNGKEYTHTLAKDATLSCDGTACAAEDLKAGCEIRVTTHQDDRNVATGVECLDQQAEFAPCCD